MVTLHINFRPSSFSDHWLIDHDDLVAELTKIMPDVKRYSSHGFKKYKWYTIEDIFRCYNSEIPGDVDGCNVIELIVIPRTYDEDIFKPEIL
ncbi:MAG TPA: hypothetical protein VK783_05150 [Bacteroidia bacterium]|jgi:hypothetical protein|nr:hypothetical protein [Bacteroidia bacterium]